jgi:hypothetical protein
MTLNLANQRTRFSGRHIQPSFLTGRCFYKATAHQSGAAAAAADAARTQLRPLRARRIRAAASARPLSAARIAGRHALLVRVVAGQQTGGSQFADAPLGRSEQEAYSRQLPLFDQVWFQDQLSPQLQTIFLEHTMNTVKLAERAQQKARHQAGLLVSLVDRRAVPGG